MPRSSLDHGCCQLVTLVLLPAQRLNPFTSAPTSAPVIIHLATFIVIIIFVVLSKLVHVVSPLKSRGNKSFLPQSCNKVSEGSTAFHDYTLIEFKLTWSRARID